MLLQTKLVSTLLRHGASPILDSTQTALAIKKSKEVLKTRTKGGSLPGQGKAENHKYGEHTGSVHVLLLMEQEGTAEELDKALDKLAPIINTFRNIPAMDLRAKKKEYGDSLDSLTQEYDKKYGASLSSSQSIEFTNICASRSFKYYRHQIIIRFIGTLEEFGEQDRLAPYTIKDGVQLYITEVKVKSVFTTELLSLVLRFAIANGSDKVIKATSRDIAFTMELRDSPYGSRFKKIRNEDLEDDDSN